MKKTKFNKKKIAVSVTSVTLVLATLIALVPYALASTDRSLEYIELLKQNESFKILEIAPSESDGVMGYYVKDSEPIANWKEKAAMLTSAAARESYVNNDVNTKLLSQGVMSTEANAAPLYLEDMYDEFYPWEIKSTEGYNTLPLDDEEAVKVRGTMEETEEGKGDYTSNDTYVPVDNFFKNYFDFSSWRTTLGETLREKLGADYDVDKFTSTKILAVNKDKKTMTVFGSTDTNWSQEFAIESSAVMYDLASVYEKPDYYAIEMEENKDMPGHYLGGAYILSLDAKVYNGKGQVSVVPYDAEGNIVKYNPNIARQYWYRQDTVDSGHFEYKFSVPENSEIKYIQIKFDVDNLKASATFSNVNVYRYSKDYFDIGTWKSNSSSITKNFNDVICVTSSVDESQVVGGKPLYPRAKVTDNESYFSCETNAFYTLTYHAELMPGGGKTKAYVIGYDSSGNLIGSDFVAADQWSQSVSGTYSVDFFSGNAAYFVVVFNITGEQAAYYSNISVVKALDFAKEDAVATHRQVIDYFSNGDVGYEYSSNIFNFHEWFNTASYDRAPGSDASSSVIADESNGIITITNRGATATSDIFKATNNMYYIPVDDSAEYRLSYTANSSSTVPHKVTVVYCDETKTMISAEEETITPTVAGPDEYRINFTTLPNCRWIQLSFGNTENNQKNVFSSINLSKKETPKVYYYNLIFTKIPTVADIGNLPNGTPVYTPKYNQVGVAGAFTPVAGEKYYYFDEYNDEYVEITDFASLSSTTKIYKFSGIYDYAGHVGEEGVTFNIKKEYYTAEINYDGYSLVENVSEIGMGTAYFTKDAATGKYITEGIKNVSTVFDPNKEYYILTSVIRETEDERHPYWVVANDFEPVDDYTALFTRKSEGYKYVGTNEGNYKFTPDPNGKEEAVISTPLVFYKGGIINNEWFKKGVLNCNEAEMNNVAVSVTTVSPTYLNSLDEEVLVYFLQGFELFVISYGGVEGTARYQDDISQQVRNALFKEALDSWETIGGMGEEVTTSQYKIPVMIDNRVCKMESERYAVSQKFDNLPGLANDLCVDFRVDGNVIEGGVNRYIYKFDTSDIELNIKSIVNQAFLEEMRARYKETTSPYFAIYKELQYENFIRTANQDKYSQLDTTVSEAAAIRYILNFRGQRIQRYKEKIRILEIQPYTDKSELLTLEGVLKPEVKLWFSPTGDLTYVDENNQVQEIDIEVTTMAMGELAAKNGSIVENNDVIYIGSSLNNINIVADHNTGGIRLNDEKKPIPDYRDDDLDGKYYTSTGDKVLTGQSGLKRSPLAGLVGGDYSAVKDVEIFGAEIFAGLEDTAGDLWWVDASDCELRKSGNDMTVSVMKQLKAFADSGRPVIFSDDLVENEFVGTFSVDITHSIVGWDEKDDLPIIRFVADLNTDGNELPEGVQPAFTWFCQTSSLNFTDKSNSRATIKNEDIDGDGINEGIYEFVFKQDDSLRGLGEYYADVSFKFAKSKYKGLRQITNLRSESVKLEYEDLWYTLEFTSKMDNGLRTVEALFALDEPAGKGYMPSLIANGGRNHIFEFVWKSRNFWGTFGRIHNWEVTFDPDPFVPDSGYDPETTREIRTSVTFDENRYSYELSLYVDETNENRPTLKISYDLLGDRKDRGYIRYYNFFPQGNGTNITSASGIALNHDAFDNSSYTYECVTDIFKNYQNVFSETMLNMNTNLERNNLIRYSNLSAPEIVITSAPKCYPETLSNDALEFKFKILNYTDDTIATTRYRYEFYVDNNSDSKFTTNELTDANVFGSGNADMSDNLKASTVEKTNEYKLYKKFPETTSGVVPWKFVIIKVGDETTEATTHNSITKYSYIKPETPTGVSAVQILPSNWNSHYKELVVGDENKQKNVYADGYMGSVFLSDVFVSEALTSETSTNLALKRVITYGIYSDKYLMNFEKSVEGTENKRYGDEAEVSAAVNAGKFYKALSVEFTVGSDWTLNIEFKNVAELNSTDEAELYNSLNQYNMLILGFGDQFGRHLQYDYNTNEYDENSEEGFQQAAVRVIERLIDEGKATLFCHDTAFYSNNMVGYIFNDIYNEFLRIKENFIEGLKEFFTIINNFIVSIFDEIIGSYKDYEKPPQQVYHSSRVKQGYYLNIGLRDKLGLDRYGVTKNIKDRIVARDGWNTYNDIKYTNESLKFGHDYSTIYYDGVKSKVNPVQNVDATFKSEMVWNKGTEITVKKRTEEFLDGFYDVAYMPGTAREKVDVFFQGYTDFTIDRLRSDDGVDDAGLAMTDRITQVNSGQITSYPYDINASRSMTYDRKDYGTFDIMPTHDQVYQVSLQTDDMGNGTTVWYSLANTENSYDIKNEKGETIGFNYNSFRNNATNGYFIYTHKNVTYTGSGHSNEFTETEAKLFINTIVAAYRIVSDKPAVNFVTPDGQTIINYQTVTSAYEETSVMAEDETIHFKLKDTSVDSEMSKSLGVKFYITPPDENGKFAENSEVAVLENQKGNTVLSLKISDAKEDVIRQKLAEEGTNELKLYALPVSTLVGFQGLTQAKTVEGDYAVLTLRELNLRSLV